MTATGRSDPDIGCPARCRAQPMFHRVLDANPVTVRAALQDVRQRFLPEVSEDTLGRLELVLAEVMNNVTEHAPLEGPDPAPAVARPPVIHLCIVRHDGGLACALTDDGVSLPEGCILPRSLPALIPGDLPEGGFGWFLIQDLTQALCYYREDSRNYLAFSLPFVPPEPT
ncbi:ATP-binding protein [Paracoccus liaowanqingii]|uniref:ATP-binding protein n=1 Tax=Paracoccus liaowanqingii TaxID=2560053 RepID=A0A4V1BJC1_9RHOB|nr:ATP-binding protein [Paracoccus liaowanqingii]QBX35772.1 ATP-binding protein [Paracoccus liaowanqingii]TGN68092.1 ATP-binding protein [Paracoccus liaowanqingii]